MIDGEKQRLAAQAGGNTQGFVAVFSQARSGVHSKSTEYTVAAGHRGSAGSTREKFPGCWREGCLTAGDERSEGDEGARRCRYTPFGYEKAYIHNWKETQGKRKRGRRRLRGDSNAARSALCR